MMSSSLQSRTRRIGLVVLLLGALLVASLALAAIPTKTAYAGGREPNITLTKDTATKMEGVIKLTMAKTSSMASQQTFTDRGQVMLGTTTYSQPKYFKSKWKITNLKNTKKSVASIEFNKPFSYQGKCLGLANYSITPKKPGSTTISFKMKSGSKVKTCKFKVKVHAYDQVIKTLKIGSLNLTKKIRDSETDNLQVSKKKLSGKFTLKLEKNWTAEVKSFWTYSTAANNYRQKETKLKSGKKYTLKSGYIYIMAKNKKDGRVRHFMVSQPNPNRTYSVQSTSSPASGGSGLVAASI